MSKSEWEAVFAGSAEDLRLPPKADIPPTVGWGERYGANEIRWVKIAPGVSDPDTYDLEIETLREVRKFRGAKDITHEDSQSLGFPEQEAHSLQLVRSNLPDWRRSLGSRASPPERSGTDARQRVGVREEGAEVSAQEIIDTLKSGRLCDEDRRRLIIAAEVLDLDRAQIDKLNALLRRFIETRRDSNDPEDLTAVASAIRKYVGTMKMEDLGSVAMLLDAGHNGSVPIGIELELAKMLVRKVTANPPETADPEPELAERLMEIARTYLSPRLLSRDKYGAVAVNTVLALLLLRSGHVGELLEILATLEVSWFTQLLARRARRLREALLQRFPAEQCQRYLEPLEAMNAQVASHNT